MLKRWKKVSTKIIHKNPWWTYKFDHFEIPGGFTGEYHYVHTNGSSMVIPITDGGDVILVRQFRYLCDRMSLEFPCGSVKDSQTYLETARLELEEETGFSAKKFDFVGEFNPYNGVADEICKVFSARRLEPSMAKSDDTEEFEVLHCTPEELEAMIRENAIWDGMTLAAWMLVRHDLL